MNILITGGAGFIGSKVAEILYKEGDQIYIIDNLSSGELSNISVENHFYQLDIEDKKCEEIFASNKIDVVVHLAGHNDFSEDEGDSFTMAKDNLAGFLNILHIAHKFKVKKFVNVTHYSPCQSELALTNPDPTKFDEIENCINDSLAITDLVEEIYENLLEETTDTIAVSLRVTNVYGPIDIKTHKMSILSQLILDVIRGNVIKMKKYEKMDCDFIYVDDVAYAVQRACNFVESPSIVISSKHKLTIERVVDILKNINPEINIDYKNYISRNISDIEPKIYKDVNDKALNELGWSPFISIEEGIKRTYEWTLENDVTIKRKLNFIEVLKKAFNHPVINKVSPYIENFLAFVFTVIIIQLLEFNNIDIQIDFRLVYIITIGMVYGLKQSSVAIILATIHYVRTIYYIDADLLSLIYNIETLLMFSIYLFVGAVLGYTVDTSRQQLMDKESEIDVLKEKYDFITEMYDESKTIREKLQEQILNSEDSFSKVYSVTTHLESLEPRVIYSKLIDIIEEVVKVKKVCLYSVAKGQKFLRMLSYSNDFDVDIPKSIPVDSFEVIEKIMIDKNLFINLEMIENLPMAIIPINNNNLVIALVFIYDMHFNDLTNYKKIMMKAVGDIATSSIIRAMKYQEAVENKKFIADTRMLKAEWFNELIVLKMSSSESSKEEVVLLKLVDYEGQKDLTNSQIDEISRNIETSVREYDYMGVDSNYSLFILLSNTSLEEASFAIKRTAAKGANFEIINEDDLNDENPKYTFIPESDIAN